MIQDTLKRINNRFFGGQPPAGGSRNARALAGGRVSMQDPHRSHTMSYFAPPEQSRSVWKQKNWTEEELLHLPVDQFMKVVTGISPEVAKAYTDFLRNCNESWGYVVDPVSATPVIDDFIARLETKHHDADVLWDRIYAGIYKGGAIFMELELNETADMAIDIAILDPYVARFAREGENWILGQWQKSKWVSLAEDPTTMYVPFNAGPNEPFGRSLMESAPIDVVRMLGVMNDFRRVLESQGWARADFEIDSERLRDFMPPEVHGDPEAEDEFIRDFINGVNQMYSNLKPNEGYGHLDIVKVNMPKGGQMQSSFFGLVDGLMRLYDRRVGRATGSTPIKQHSNESVAETHAVEQRKDYRINISSIQSTTAGALSTLCGYVLRAEGVQGKVMFYFENTPDPADVKALEEAEGVKLDNLKKLKELRDMGGIDASTYQDAVNKYKAEKMKHAAGMRSVGTYNLQRREIDHHCVNPDCQECAADFQGDRAATLSPDGSDQPLPAVPSDFEVNAAHLAAAIETFEELFPDYVDLLNGRVTGISQTTAIETVRQGNWVWNDLTKTYRNTETKKRLTEQQCLTLRDEFVDELRDTFSSDGRAFCFTEKAKQNGNDFAHRRRNEQNPRPSADARMGSESLGLRDLTTDLVNGLKTIQEWLHEMRQKIRDAFSALYMLARGGRNAMTQEDLDTLTEQVESQFDYLQAFGDQIAAGALTASQIRARSELYMEAATSAYERGKAAGYGVQLPEYPGDGNQDCGVRCRCHWHIVRVGEQVQAYWKLNLLAKHCRSCLENAAKWAPYTVK